MLANYGTAVPERRGSMRLIGSVMMNIGAVFLIAGGVLLISALFGFAIWLVGKIWIAASNKWRRILRAESLIYEYRQNRDEFLMWKHELVERKEGDDNA